MTTTPMNWDDLAHRDAIMREAEQVSGYTAHIRQHHRFLCRDVSYDLIEYVLAAIPNTAASRSESWTEDDYRREAVAAYDRTMQRYVMLYVLWRALEVPA